MMTTTTTQRTTFVAKFIVARSSARNGRRGNLGRRGTTTTPVRAAIFGFGGRGGANGRKDEERTAASTTTTEVNADAVARLERAVAMDQQPKPVKAGGKEPPVKKRTAVMAGNWKLNPKTMDEARTLAALVGAAAKEDKAPGVKTRECEVFVCPPAPFISEVSRILDGSGVAIGAQNIYHEASGAFTGEMSAEMAKSVGCTHVLVGHSERRELFGETDEMTNLKTRKIIDSGMTAVLCIGETKDEYEAGQAKSVCARQLAAGLAGVEADEMTRVIIAYEPVWAIGTGLTATPAIAQSVHAGIRDWFGQNYGESVASKVRIQYGGSVKPETVDELMEAPDVDGCLVGGASLNAEQFGRIFNYDTAPEGPIKLWAEEVVPCGNQLGESPVWSVDRQTLYWVDAPAGTLYSWNLKSAPTKTNFGETLGCVALRSNNTLLLGLESGLHSYDPSTKRLQLVSEFEPGLNTRPNDGRTDREGNFIIGSYNNAHRVDAQPIGGLWRLPVNGGALEEVLDYKFRCSNCICFTKSGTTMFFCDTPTRRIYQFDYDARTGPSNRRLLYELPSSVGGGPDGAQCDASGNVWAAISGAGRVIRITPAGEVDLVVELPVKQPTSVTLGGPGMNTLFITTRAENGRKDAGSLFACQVTDTVGVQEVEYRDPSAVNGDALSPTIGPVVPGAVKSSAKFCVNCGVAFEKNGARFCAFCGTARR